MHTLNPISQTFISFFLLIVHSCISSVSSQTSFVVPINKDNSTNLYTLSPVYIKTPLQPTILHLDLGSPLSWIDCSRRYKSSSYQHVLQETPLCDSLKTLLYTNCFKKPGPGCTNNSCGYFPVNPVTGNVDMAQIMIDSLALTTTNGSLNILLNHIFSCAHTKLLRGLPVGVTGVVGLGRFNYSLPWQLSRAFSFSSSPVFALCLPNSSSLKGVALFNFQGPYIFYPGSIDFSKLLTYTPLLLNPRGPPLSYWLPSSDYYIGVTSIKVNGKIVPLNQTVLKLNEENGFGGIMLNTSSPYTVLQGSIFKPVVDAFVAESAAFNLKLTTPVKPFKVCYKAKTVNSTSMGPNVPVIDLVLQDQNVVWRIFGSNSMVRIKAKNVDVWCLGLVDGGPNLKTSINIGGNFMENHLLQFDLKQKRLGFSSSLLLQHTSCASFNSTSSI